MQRFRRTWEKHRSNMSSSSQERRLSFQMWGANEEWQQRIRTVTQGRWWEQFRCSDRTGLYFLGWCHTWFENRTRKKIVRVFYLITFKKQCTANKDLMVIDHLMCDQSSLSVLNCKSIFNKLFIISPCPQETWLITH